MVSQPVQKRSFLTASNLLRTAPSQALKPAVSVSVHQTRGLKQIDFAGTKETVYGMFDGLHTALRNSDHEAEREDWPREKLLVSSIEKSDTRER